MLWGLGRGVWLGIREGRAEYDDLEGSMSKHGYQESRGKRGMDDAMLDLVHWSNMKQYW